MCCRQRNVGHQEDDDRLLGVTWRDMAQLGVFGGVGYLGKFGKCPQIGPQVDANTEFHGHFLDR